MKHPKAFDELVKHILKWEGGLFISSSEGGGAANKGVTYSTYQQLARKLLGVEPTWEHFKKLSDYEAAKFIKSYYDAIKGDSIENPSIAMFLTEIAWGSGVITAGKTIQKVLNQNFGKTLTINGVIGNETINAINSVNPSYLFDKIAIERQRFLNDIAKRPELSKFLTGWTRRVNDFISKKENFGIVAAGGAGILLTGFFIWYLFFRK